MAAIQRDGHRGRLNHYRKSGEYCVEQENKVPIKGIRIRTLNFGMIFVSCVLYILLIVASFYALREYQAMVVATDSYIASEKNALLLAEGSDYLTEEVRLFAVNADLKHVENYFTEVYTTKRREKVFELFESYETHENYNLLQKALDDSNNLMKQEIYSMKLVASAQNYDMEGFEDVQKVELSPEDQALGPEEKREKARDLVFGTEYQEKKALIMDGVSTFMNEIIQESQQEQQESTDGLRVTMHRQQVLISILFIENILVFILIIRLIIKPLQIYIRNIKDEKRMEIIGSYEFKYLALTYNNIFELNVANEAVLRHQAEHDPLTGLMNRGAFEQLRKAFRANSDPLILMIIDVDKFKLVNDGYGHEMGDKVLKKVARLLEESFRTTDFCARIGGDEFAVIMVNAMSDMKSVVVSKINALNDKLLHPDDGLPKVSLSVGAAYSEHGFTDELYNQADKALYVVKEHGRCDCRFYKR